MAASSGTSRPARPAQRSAKDKADNRADRDVAKASGRIWAGGWAE